MNETEELMGLIPEGMFENSSELESFINQQGMQGVYDLLPSGMFGSVSELEEAFGSKKKEPSPSELTPSQSPEEVAAGVQEAVGSVPLGAEPSPFSPDDPYGYTQDTPIQTGVEVVREVDTDFKPIADTESTGVDIKGPGERIDEPEPEEDRLFEMSMAAVTPDLIDAPDDRDTAKELSYQFGRYGFEFTTTPLDFHDQVTVKSADGAEITVNLDPMLDIGKEEETQKLRDFLRRHKMQSQALTQAEQGYEEARLQFGTRKQIDDEFMRINTVENDYRTMVNSYAARVDSINQKYTAESIKANPTELEQYKADMASLEEDRVKLLTMGDDLDTQAQDLERAAGEFVKLKAQQSTVLGFSREALSRGTAGIFGEPVSLLIDAASQIIPLGSGPNYQKGFLEAAQEMGISDIPEGLFATEGLPTINGAPVYTPELRKAYDDWYASLSKDTVGDVRDKMRDQMAKGLKYNPEMGGMVDAAYEGVYRTLGDRKFNEEAYAKAQEGFLGKTALSLLESVPAFIGRPGGNAAMKAASRFARMENQVAGQVDREFRADPELAKVSEGEKLLLKKTIGLTVGALEQFGFRNALGRSGVVNGILMRVINKAPVGVKGKAFRDLVQQEIKSATARGLIATGTAALAEAETEFVQTYAEVGAKDIYNALKGKEMFKNADTFSKETFFQAMEAAASGAIGGAVLGTPGSIAAAATTYDFTTLDDATLATFEFLANPGNRGASKQMFVADLKNKVNRGEMTGQQAKDAEANYERVVQAYDGMREVGGMTMEEKKQVLGLEVRRQELIRRKEATAAPFQGRIDREISDINLKIQDALQEREATPVDVEERARDSEAVDGEVREEEAVVTAEAEEEVIPEAATATNQDRKSYDGGTIESPRLEQILSGVADKVRSKGRMTAFQSRLLTENRERVDRLVELKDRSEAEALREEAALDETIETLAPNVESRRVTTDALSIIQNRVVTRAKAAAKAISKVAPDVKFVLHETTAQYNRATGYSGAGVFDDGKVHINLELANNRTVAHETLHAIIRSADGMTLKATQEVTKRMATSLSKSLDKGSELKKRIDKFLSQYDENIRDEEQVAELFGYMADGYANLEAPQKSIIRRYVEKLAEAVGIKLPSGWGKQDEDVIDFLNTVSRKVTEGEVITEEEVAVARSTSRKQTEDKLGAAEQKVDDFSEEQIQAMADEGVIFHFSDVDITKVLPEKLKRFALGYGFYFTNYALENSVYRNLGDRFTMVKAEDFNLIDGDTAITEEQAKAIRDAAKMELEEMREYDDYLLGFEIEDVLTSLSGTKAGESWVDTFTRSRDYDRTIIAALIDEQLEVPTRIVQEMLGFDGVVYGADMLGERAGAINIVWNFPKIDRAIIEPGQEPRAAEQRVTRIDEGKPKFNRDGLAVVKAAEQKAFQDATPKALEEYFAGGFSDLRDVHLALANRPDVRLWFSPIGGGFYFGYDTPKGPEILARFSIRESGANDVELELLEATEAKGRRIGSRFMTDFTAALDETNTTARLMAYPLTWYERDMQGNEADAVAERLVDFYSKFGFTRDTEGDTAMTREPGAEPVVFDEETREDARFRNRQLNLIEKKKADIELAEKLTYNSFEALEDLLSPTQKSEIEEVLGMGPFELSFGELTEEQVERALAEIYDAPVSDELLIEDFDDLLEFASVLREEMDELESMQMLDPTPSTPRAAEQRIDIDAVRTRSRAGNRVSKGLATYNVNKVQQVEEIENLTRDYVREQAPKAYIKNANVIAKYPLVRGVREFGEITTVEQADELYDIYTQQTMDNLRWMMETYPDEFSEISTLWYDGANKIANELATEFGVSPEQAAGILASLSPQKDWYQNVRLAELLMEAFEDNPVMTREMIVYQKKSTKAKIAEKKKDLKKARAVKGTSKARAKVEKFNKDKARLLNDIEVAEALLDAITALEGTRMMDADPSMIGYFVRLHAETTKPISYQVISPDGEMVGPSKKDDGSTAKWAWGSYNEIGKGVSVMLNGSQENITASLGQQHKVRNFYNNIIDPMSTEGDVTMDTHAIAVSLLKPLSTKSDEVNHNFGGKGAASSGAKGIKGTYYANQEAYQMLAEEMGMLPRQIQSVTWEAVRGLFTDKFKGNKENVKAINQIWENYAEGKITIDEARAQVLERAGGVNPPVWAESVQGESREGVRESRERGADREGGRAAEQRVDVDTEGPTIVYRSGAVDSKAESRGRMDGGRSTGHFGTGAYFFGDRESAEAYDDRDVTAVDISGYNLAPATYSLHDALTFANIKGGGAMFNDQPHTIGLEEVRLVEAANRIEKRRGGRPISYGNKGRFNELYDIIFDEYYRMMLPTAEAERIAAEATRLYNEEGNIDSVSTSIMKALGYEGVNAVGTPLDNSTYGTVIYDVKTEPKAAEQRVGDVVSRYEFKPNGSLKNASLAAELRRNLKRYGFGVKQFGTRMNDFHIVNPDTGRKVDPKKLIEKSRVEREEERLEQEEFRAEQEAIELAERERELFETEEAPFLETIFPESDLSAAEQKADLDKGPTELERLVAYAKERGYSNAAILLSRPEAQAAIDAYEEAEKRMLKELNGVIKKTRARVDATEERVLESALGYLQGSKFYADATDVGRELMVRGLREKLGLKEKRAPSAKRIVSGPVERITITVREALKNQLKSEARGARAAAAASKAVLKQMAADITELQREGKITAKQAATVIRKFASVNVFNPVAVDNFLDYMAKVFADAEYANDIAKLRKKIPGAKKGAKRKLGRQPQLIFDILTVLAIDPTRIPVDVLPEFSKLVEILSKNKSVLALPDIQDLASSVSSILDAVNQEQSLADELADIFEAFEDKVPTKSGGVNFSETLKAMVSAGVIDEADATLMRKYKSDIVDTTRTKKTDEQLETEAKEMRSIIKDSTVNVNRLGTRLDRDAARRFEKLLGTKAVDELNNRQLENLLRVIDNINNGYLTHSAQLAIERMEAKNRGRAMSKALEGAKLNSIREIGGYLTNVKDARLGAIVRNPLELIDQVFGNFKTTPIYDATFRPIAEAAAAMMTEKGKIGERLAKAQEAVAKSHKRDPNAVVRAKYLMTTYLLQLEHESNPGNNTTPSAMAFLNATIAAQEDGKTTKYNKADIGILKGIIDKYAKGEEIDAEAIYSDFNAAEKGALKTIQDINTELTPKAEFASAVIRGSAIEPVLNYLHHSVLTDETMRTDKTDALRLSEAYNQGMRPSTRSKTFVDRTPGAKPLEFDIMASVNRGVNQTLTDFYLTEPIRTARKALKETKTGNKEVLRSITNAVDGAVRNALERSVTTSNLAEKALDFVSRQGYRTMLASIPRFASELISNLSYVALADPAAFEQGIKYRDYFGVDGADIMTNVGSAQTKRVYPSERLSGRMVDTSIMSGNMGSTTSRAGRDIENSVRQAMNYAGAYPGAVATIADTLISTPDKLIMRPLWFGAFAKAFKDETGKDVDYDAIGRNDEAYMTEYAEAIEAAKREADRVSSQAGATDNPFMGIQKGKSKSEMKPLMQTLRIANNFMSRFIIYEFTAARTGIQAAVGNGTLTQEQGARLFFAVLARMTMYSLLTPMLSDMFTSLFADVPEEDEDPEQLFARALTSGLTTMAGGVMGQLGRIPVNYGIETINEKHLDFLRNGEYDPYDDYLQFNTIPDFNRGTDFADFMFPLMGAGAPMAKTVELGLKTIGREGKKRATRERYAREQMQRLPLEVLGNLGLVPFYRDVRKVLMADMYGDLAKKKKGGKIMAN